MGGLVERLRKLDNGHRGVSRVRVTGEQQRIIIVNNLQSGHHLIGLLADDRQLFGECGGSDSTDGETENKTHDERCGDDQATFLDRNSIDSKPPTVPIRLRRYRLLISVVGPTSRGVTGDCMPTVIW